MDNTAQFGNLVYPAGNYTRNGLDQRRLSSDVEGHLAEYQFFPTGGCCHAQLVVLDSFALLLFITFARKHFSVGFLQEIQGVFIENKQGSYYSLHLYHGSPTFFISLVLNHLQ